ncbi:glycosyltransferase family 2 protein [Microbacterium sp.]|uniref:glycosyltransferase family 2 protein n=1 Tax=Microbacterium sp. TaxID=51671 RepID=UPI003A9212A4
MSKYNVTVGIPMVREPLSQIELAVRSVYAQTFADWELVFFADGSPEEHIDLLRRIDDPRVRIIVNESSQGIASSLNRLADIADGKYIAILAADDMWTPQRLAIQVARLEEDDAPDVLAAQMVIISDDETVEGAQKPARIPDNARGWVEGTPISHATAMARSEWFRSHPYDESLIRAQDRAFWITAHRGSVIEILEEPVYYYRVPKPTSYRKYAWSSKFARRVIWKYGRTVLPTPAVVEIYARSIAKQMVTAAVAVFGGSERLYQRRIDPISEEQERAHLGTLAAIRATPVPGWDSRAT